MNEGFRRVQVSGTPHECGRQHGEQLAQQIHVNLAGYWRLFQHKAGLDRAEVLARSESFLGPIRTFGPHLLDELTGIAEGAGISLIEVVALNCRTEILSSGLVPLDGGCTAVFCAPEITADGHTLMGQNWDWSDHMRGGTVLLRIQQPGRPVILTLTEAGMVGKIGFNSAGVGVCTNFLRHQVWRPGVPFHLILREMLNATRPGLAVAAVYRGARADSGSYMVAHRDGEGLSLEATPKQLGLIHPADGLLVHTNHFLTSRLQDGDQAILMSDNTLWRYGRATHLLRQQAGKITPEVIQSVFRDHFDFPNSICRHPDPSVHELERVASLASVVMDLTAGRMWASAGEPCTAEYHLNEI